MGTEYDIFQRLPGNKVVWIGSVSGWRNLQRTLGYYAKLSSGELVAIDARTHEVVGADAAKIEIPAKRAKATAA